jgi:DNA-binding NarL/FixJ family response regulator
MIALSEYSELVTTIYDAGLDDRRWPVALERLARAFNASQVVLSHEDLARQLGATVAHGADPAYVRSYLDRYMHHNPLSARRSGIRAGSIVTDRMVLPKEEFQRTEFRNDFLRPQDVETCLTVVLLHDGDRVSALALWRPERGREWDRPELDLLSLLAPHLKRAVDVNRRICDLRFEQQSAFEALERLQHGIVIVQTGGKISFVNRAAAAIVARADGVTINGSGFHAALPSHDAALQRAIAAAAGDGSRPCTGAMLALSRPSGRRSFAVHVVPLRVPSDSIVDRRAGAVVMIVDPEQELQIAPAQLRQLYDLTPAEATVATLILHGQGLQSVADELRVTLSTVRIHLQRVFEKTQTHRQAELVRRLLDIQAGIRPDEPTR